MSVSQFASLAVAASKRGIHILLPKKHVRLVSICIAFQSAMNRTERSYLTLVVPTAGTFYESRLVQDMLLILLLWTTVMMMRKVVTSSVVGHTMTRHHVGYGSLAPDYNWVAMTVVTTSSKGELTSSERSKSTRNQNTMA